MIYSIQEQIFDYENKIVQFKKLKNLESDEFDQISEYIDVINLYYHFEDYFLIVEKNYFELMLYIDKEFKTLENNQLVTFMNTNFLKDARIEINRKILNYLSSSRTFIDHISRILKGKDLQEKIKEHLNNIYDNNFSYRFYYKLRNYAQHKGLPITWFSVDAVDLKTKTMIFAFDIQHLLADYDSWGNMKQDLIEFGINKLDSKHVSHKYQENITEIYIFCQSLFEEQLRSSSLYLIELLEKFKTNNELIIMIEENSLTTRTIPLSKEKITVIKEKFQSKR